MTTKKIGKKRITTVTNYMDNECADDIVLSSLEDAYKVLQIPHDKRDDNEYIKKVYRSIALVHHPDKAMKSSISRSGYSFELVNVAYDMVKNREKYIKNDRRASLSDRIKSLSKTENVLRGFEDHNNDDGDGMNPPSAEHNSTNLDRMPKAIILNENEKCEHIDRMECDIDNLSSQSKNKKYMNMKVRATISDVFHDGIIKFIIPKMEECEMCKSKQNKSTPMPSRKRTVCKTCKGKGTVRRVIRSYNGDTCFEENTCITCRGKSASVSLHSGNFDCTKCYGKGILQSSSCVTNTSVDGNDEGTLTSIKLDMDHGTFYHFINLVEIDLGDRMEDIVFHVCISIENEKPFHRKPMGVDNISFIGSDNRLYYKHGYDIECEISMFTDDNGSNDGKDSLIPELDCETPTDGIESRVVGIKLPVPVQYNGAWKRETFVFTDLGMEHSCPLMTFTAKGSGFVAHNKKNGERGDIHYVFSDKRCWTCHVLRLLDHTN